MNHDHKVTTSEHLPGSDHQHQGGPTRTFSAEFLETNKTYYLAIEDYDWVDASDNWRGLEALFHKLRERKVRQLVKRFSRSGLHLDAGCGTAMNSRHLPPGSIGIDINPRNLPRARRWAPQGRFLHGDLEALPFPDSSFSTILCTEVLEHFPVPQLPLSELLRVLQPNGRLIGSVPATSWIWHLRFLSSTCPHAEPFHNNFEEAEIRNLLQGLRIVTLERSCFSMSWMFVAERP